MRIGALSMSCLVALLCAVAASPCAAATSGVTGSVVLLTPGTNAYAGVLLEQCSGNFATMRVILAQPQLLQSTQFLAIQVGRIEVPAIRVDANNEGPEVAAFDGVSTAGCVAAGTRVSLVISPCGKLNSLLVVMGKGTLSI